MGSCPLAVVHRRYRTGAIEVGVGSQLAFEHAFDTLGILGMGGQLVSERFEVRETEYGYGIWDAKAGDWWIRRLDMTQRDAEQIVAELRRGEAEL
ncbi:hypothetical protein GCM10009872_19260 [Actinopolymorpha rutila]